jgi:type IV pilus assembly protein PilB
MLGEIRDKDTGDMAVKASLTGHLVLSSLHTNSASSTITRLINMGIPNYLISSSLSLVIAQRLFRKNCTDCLTVDHSIKKYDLNFIGISGQEAEKIIPKKGQGCPSCMNTGYKGRQAIHEVLEITENIQEIILRNGTTNEMETAAVKEYHYKNMQSQGHDLIKEGTLSIDEFRRVLTLK